MHNSVWLVHLRIWNVRPVLVDGLLDAGDEGIEILFHISIIVIIATSYPRLLHIRLHRHGLYTFIALLSNCGIIILPLCIFLQLFVIDLHRSNHFLLIFLFFLFWQLFYLIRFENLLFLIPNKQCLQRLLIRLILNYESVRLPITYLINDSVLVFGVILSLRNLFLNCTFNFLLILLLNFIFLNRTMIKSYRIDIFNLDLGGDAHQMLVLSWLAALGHSYALIFYDEVRSL